MSNENEQSEEDRTQPRQVPELLLTAWKTAISDPDPLVALGAVRALNPLLASWEDQLASEAQAAGATWETIGGAVGVSRQAAWARFRDEKHKYRRKVEAEFRDLHERHRQESMELRERIRNEVGGRRGRGRR